jgi:hypothetical protein
MRTAYFSKCPKCQTYTVFVFVTYTHRRVFHLSLSRLLSDYFTVGLITGRYTSTYFLSIKFQQILVFRISEDGSEASAVRVAYLFTSNIVCDISCNVCNVLISSTSCMGIICLLKSDLSLLTDILRTMKFDIYCCVTLIVFMTNKIYNFVNISCMISGSFLRSLLAQ